jgi:acyl-CoA synthetase (AMP-forming)/AMP-acid ligase II
MVVVAEISRHATEWDEGEVGAAVRRAVSARHSVALHDFVLVVANDVPRTSSGKIARSATRAKYLEGSLAVAR